MKRQVEGFETRKNVSIIVAVDSEGGFSKEGKIPWKLPKDMKMFKEITNGGVCIMGRNTFLDMERMAKGRKPKKPNPKKHSKTFLEGYEAFQNGKAQFANPHTMTSENSSEPNEYLEWNAGWTSGMNESTLNGVILPGRQSIVLSRNKNFSTKRAQVYPNLRQSIESLPSTDVREIFILGGEKLFIEGLSWANKLYMTIIDDTYDCDQFFPIDKIDKYFKLVKGKKETDKGTTLFFAQYLKK